MAKRAAKSSFELSGKCKGREVAHEVLSPVAPCEELHLACGEVKTLGKGFAKGIVEALLSSDRVKTLVVLEAPPHGVLYLREHCHRLGLSERLTIIPREKKA